MKITPVKYKVSKTIKGQGKTYGSISSAEDRRRLKGSEFHIYEKDKGHTDKTKRTWRKIR